MSRRKRQYPRGVLVPTKPKSTKKISRRTVLIALVDGAALATLGYVLGVGRAAPLAPDVRFGVSVIPDVARSYEPVVPIDPRTTYYVSVNGSPDGDGSAEAPIDLRSALEREDLDRSLQVLLMDRYYLISDRVEVRGQNKVIKHVDGRVATILLHDSLIMYGTIYWDRVKLIGMAE